MEPSPAREGVARARILMVPAKPWPCDHAMLDAVYARALPARGHRVEWVMWSELPGSVAAWNGTRVHLTEYSRGTALAAARRWWRLLAEVRRLVRSGAFDLVQVRNSTAGGLLAIVLRRRARIRVVFQLSFPVAEWTREAARRGQVRTAWLRIPATRLQVAIRRAVARRADLVLAISDRMRADLLRDGVSPGRVLTFPLGADELAEPDEREVDALRAELGVEDDPVVLYFGSISPQRELGFLVEVARTVRETIPACRWLLVGPSADGERERLTRAAARAGVADSFAVLDPVPRSRIPVHLAVASLTVSPVPPVGVYLASSPAKLVESLAAGRAVVATPIPDQETVARESGGGVIAPFEPRAFAAAVAGLLADEDLRRRMGQAGRAWVREHRSYALLADRVEEAYRRLPAIP